MYNVIFNSGFIGLLIWLLLFAASTTAVALIIRCIWILRQKRFGFATKLMPLLKAGDWDDAYAFCEANPTVTMRIAGTILLAAHSKNKTQRQELAVVMLGKEVRAILRWMMYWPEEKASIKNADMRLMLQHAEYLALLEKK